MPPNKRILRSQTLEEGNNAASKAMDIVELLEDILTYLTPAELAAAMRVSIFWFNTIRTSTELRKSLYFYELLPNEYYDKNLPFETRIWNPIVSKHSGYWTVELQAPEMIGGVRHVAAIFVYSSALPISRAGGKTMKYSAKSKIVKPKDVLRHGLMLEHARFTKHHEPVIAFLQSPEHAQVNLRGPELYLGCVYGLGEIVYELLENISTSLTAPELIGTMRISNFAKDVIQSSPLLKPTLLNHDNSASVLAQPLKGTQCCWSVWSIGFHSSGNWGVTTVPLIKLVVRQMAVASITNIAPYRIIEPGWLRDTTYICSPDVALMVEVHKCDKKGQDTLELVLQFKPGTTIGQFVEALDGAYEDEGDGDETDEADMRKKEEEGALATMVGDKHIKANGADSRNEVEDVAKVVGDIAEE
ncbi:hypothetical protein LTR08_003662 [Meristemomyces frigidus]|nr:hypothetical protein LTR08_003662 [Meristemomyces frigidus]